MASISGFNVTRIHCPKPAWHNLFRWHCQIRLFYTFSPSQLPPPFRCLIFTIPGCISIRISGISGVSLLGLRADVQHVVASDEGIAVLVLQLTIDVLLGLLHGEVHVAILR